MTWGIIFLAGMVIGCFYLLVVVLARSDSGRTGPSRGRSYYNRFASVDVHFGDDACEAVKSLRDIRYLKTAAPLLPLWECDRIRCACRYQHHEDRRHRERRDEYARDPREELFERRINRIDRRRKYANA